MQHPVFIGSARQADLDRQRVAADLRARGASIALWLAVSLSLGIAAMSAWTQLAAAEAALKCAAGV